MRIALLQVAAVPLDLEANLDLIDDAAGKARAGAAQLLLTPELFATGYAPQDVRDRLPEDRITAARTRLAEIARTRGIALVHCLPGVASAASVSPDASVEPAITVVFVDDAGIERAVYEKTHLFGPEERAAFRAGTSAPPVIRWEGLRFGLLVCYDVEFPETVRHLAAAGADVVLVPTALAGAPAVTGLLVPSRAAENLLSVAYANHVGEEAGLDFDGESLVAGPGGQVLVSAGTRTGVFFAEVGPALHGPPVRERPEGPWYLEDRRPSLYRRWAAEHGETPR
ncbi:nitrilase-related carbon-nitrogen hydrolase [Nesterenkonia marinintestina]|uniref:nitrilase-related carbon-nitrogen hydrolase n=1 Tax=Nesterenkonia marinintestina TaxID=2979865 RepID=UPI0021BE6F88|nr:nitrilase-related carbon-nitrogen hydrolase [Nesterenkonia sp. GX14115]